MPLFSLFISRARFRTFDPFSGRCSFVDRFWRVREASTTTKPARRSRRGAARWASLDSPAAATPQQVCDKESEIRNAQPQAADTMARNIGFLRSREAAAHAGWLGAKSGFSAAPPSISSRI